MTTSAPADNLADLPQSRRPPFLLALAVCTAITLAMIVLRMWVLPHRYLPLADCLPLLVCLWTRYRRLLWGMAIAFTVITLSKILYLGPVNIVAEPLHERLVTSSMMMANIWLTAAVLHSLLNARDRLEQHIAWLQQTNAELEDVNEELVVREVEIERQNEELHSQTQALESQAKELQSQTQALERQGCELRKREKALEALLDSSRWLRTDLDRQAAISRICEVAMKVLEGDAHAVAIVQRCNDGQLTLRGCAGLGPSGAARQSWPYERSFASVVMEQGKTGYLTDISLRPDLEVLQPLDGPTFQSVLATPLRVGNQCFGAVVVYSSEPREWNDTTFKVVEWLADQIALVLEAIDLHVQLHQRRTQAEEASQRKTRFLAAVSHDVRTPANAINLMAELISRSARNNLPAAEIAEMARDLQASARLLVELVSDVLDLARFDSAVLDLQLDDFELWPVIHAEVRQLLPLAQDQSLRLHASIPSDPVWLRADRMKLARVLGNLIGNAIKFTESGGVEVRCVQLSDRSIDIKVIDTGIGIAPDHLTDIFDEFFQLRNPARDRSHGTGLGLAICKRLVSAMDCTLSVESSPGKGSAFTLHIPPRLVVSPPTSEPQLSGGRPQSHGRLAGLRILLVEDHEMTRRATARILAGEGATVMQAEHGRAALHILAHDFPQVLLLDLMLPDIDGADILRKLQTHRPASLKCMLAVSGDVSAARAEEIQSLGAQALIPKPVNIDTLVNTITASFPPKVLSHA